ncbi:ubiquitin-like-specific protease ESD4 [Euphorbia lathyris]|uniref:ubiquitin-like-specific protease ESD4 n=1 Tax=Euphorbia lathyris TaxID=212925 RepID=UPI003313BDE2
MGALTSNSKRDPLPISPDFHISKKARFSFMHQNPSQTPGFSNSIRSPISRHPETNPKPNLGFSNSIVSRISRYPETTSKFRREVHAPCRVDKFGFLRSHDIDYSEKQKSFADDMGNFLGRKLESAKRKAFGTLRHFLKDKQVIDVDNELQKSQKEVVSEDSSVEEVGAREADGREGRSIVLDQSSRDGALSNKDDDDDDVKIVEERSVVTLDEDMGVEDDRKMLDALVLRAGLDDVGVYKKLLESVDRRNGRLEELDFDIQLIEKKLSFYQSTRPVQKPAEKDISQEAFTPLTEEEESVVERALSRQCRRKVLVNHRNSNIDITGEALSCLQPREWLNDEVINLYLELLKEREKREPQKFLKCHFFNTFFYKKLTSGAAKKYDYKAVRRWTTERKLGYFLIECDKIFVPVHRDIHWVLAIINRKEKKFQYLDSLKGRDFEALEFLAKYFVDEVKDKCKKDIDVSNWEREFLVDLPTQQNGFDCGVFMIKYADFYSRDIGLCFSQEHMPYFRKRTAKEILRLRAD